MTDDEYTPTTEDVRWAYSIDAEWEHRDPINAGANRKLHRRQFDRWLADTLARHDAEVAATIAEMVRWGRVPPVDSYAADVITAVADWILDPPDWVDAPWAGRGK